MTTDTDLRPPVQQKQSKNTVGMIALIVAIVGTLFAVIPGAMFLGWVLLPIAFVLSIISFFMRDQKRGQGIAALIVSIVGTLIGFIVFVGVVGTAVDEAFNESTEVSVSEDEDPDTSAKDDVETVGEEGSADDGASHAAEGTRENPLPIGSTISTSDWEVTVNSVNLDATSELSSRPLNDAPEAGNVYIMINLTAKYVGTDPDGATPWASVEFVSAAGNTYDRLDSLLIAEDSFESLDKLYEGASTTGDIALEVPAEDLEQGTLRVSADLFSDDKFFAVQ